MEENLNQQLQTLNRLYKESEEIYRGLADRFGLSTTAFWIVYAISHAEQPYTQNDICNEWFYPVQTINSAVSSLVKKGLILLEAIPGTRNRKKILLTEEGRRLAELTVSKVDEIEKNAFLLFSAKERETYITLFKRHLENLRKEEKKVLDSIMAQTPS